MASKKSKTKPAEGSSATPDAASTKRHANKTKQSVKGKANDVAAPGKLSALDAAAKVLQESGQPMNCQAMIQDMAAKGYWSSPKGKTPASTLYSALLREIKLKGGQARFQKTDRGRFAYQTPQAS